MKSCFSGRCACGEQVYWKKMKFGTLLWHHLTFVGFDKLWLTFTMSEPSTVSLKSHPSVLKSSNLTTTRTAEQIASILLNHCISTAHWSLEPSLPVCGNPHRSSRPEQEMKPAQHPLILKIQNNAWIVDWSQSFDPHS